MAELKFTPEEDNLLITLIEGNKALYDTKSDAYKDIVIKAHAWTNISQFLSKPDEECRKRWKHIRDSYNRFKRKKKSGGVLRSKNSKFQFYRRLSKFLEKVPFDDIPINTPTDNNSDSDNTIIPCKFNSYGMPDDEMDEDDDEYQVTIEDIKPFQMPYTTLSPLETPTCHRKTKFNEFIEEIKQSEENRQNMKDLSQRTEDSQDDDWSFGNHVKTVLKKLTPRLKLLAKKEIFDILTKYESFTLDVSEKR